MFWFFGHESYKILAHDPGIKHTPPALEGEILTLDWGSLQSSQRSYIVGGAVIVTLETGNWSPESNFPMVK